MNHKTIKTVALASAALFALCWIPTAQAQTDHSNASQGVLSLTLEGLESDRGQIWVGVYAGAEDWAAEAEARTAWVDVREGRAVVVIDQVPAGEIAVQVFHDANGNRDFDTNFAGIPRERYGYSNNPRPRFRAANWDEAAFELAPGETRAMTITLHGVRG